MKRFILWITLIGLSPELMAQEAPNKEEILERLELTQVQQNISDYYIKIRNHRDFMAVKIDRLRGLNPIDNSQQKSVNKQIIIAELYFSTQVQLDEIYSLVQTTAFLTTLGEAILGSMEKLKNLDDEQKQIKANAYAYKKLATAMRELTARLIEMGTNLKIDIALLEPGYEISNQELVDTLNDSLAIYDQFLIYMDREKLVSGDWVLKSLHAHQ